MAGQVKFALDDVEFQKAMTEYIQTTSKDGAFAMNRTMNNLAIFGTEESKVAQDDEIQRIQQLDWWPMYVASVMVRRKAAQLTVKMEKATRKGKVMGGKTFQRLAKLHYTREEARKESARIIRRRSVAIGFVRFFFVTMSRQVAAIVPGMRTPSSKTFKGFEVTVKPATMQDPSISARVVYDYRSRGEKAVKKAEALLSEILERARPRVIADMREYITRKLTAASEAISV